MNITALIKSMHQEADADNTSYPAVLDTDIGIIRLNSAVETLVSKIMQVCRNFPFDDDNFTNITEGTIDLTASTSKYTITDKFLDILEIKVKDNNGKWHIVEPVTQAEDESIVETGEAETGLPTKYRMVGRTIFLRPAPVAASVTLTAGLLFKYTRTSYQITTADVSTGTLVIGIASPWHATAAKMAALPYCKTYKKDRVTQLERDINQEIYGRDGLLDYYANRQKNRGSRLIPVMENNK